MQLTLPDISATDATILNGLPPRIAALLAGRLCPAPTVARSIYEAAVRGDPVVWHPTTAPDAAAVGWPLLAPALPAASERWQMAAIRETLADVRDPLQQAVLTAGLLQLNDWLDESHQASQGIEGQGRIRDGDYWHAIMHRREPDYGNAKYWFRSVGRHPIFPALRQRAAEVLNQSSDPGVSKWRERLCPHDQWEPFAFVDLCQAVGRDEASPLGTIARRIQWIEMLLLLSHGLSG